MLVAHNGFAFHYLFLIAEIKRHDLEENFAQFDLWFADTLHDARRVRIHFWYLFLSHISCYQFARVAKPPFDSWSEERGLGLQSLFQKCFPKELYEGF